MRLFAWFDRLTAEQDARAASLGMVVTRRGRWSSTYTDPRAGWLAAARAAGCEHVPVCPLSGAGLPTCSVPTTATADAALALRRAA